MLNLFAQALPPRMFYEAPGGSDQAKVAAIVVALIGFGIFFAMTKIPSNYRRPIVVTMTFLAGVVYVIRWLWPEPIGYDPSLKPLNGSEEFAIHLTNGEDVMAKVLQVVQGFLLFLGVYSVLRVHAGRFFKRQKDWVFSLVLLLSMVTMITVGYWEYNSALGSKADLSDRANWTAAQFSKDFLFDGLLQVMDAAMFSIIAFYILSAAYRAFRIRSLEATILLATALIVMLSLMGGVEYASTMIIERITGGDPGHFMNNFSLASIRGWIQETVQGPAIRGLEWGIMIGSLAMGLRLWLSLEKGN